MKMERKTLSNTVCEAGIGFKRREDLDFRDDGTSFKGFEYKGMPITQARSGGLTFLSVRPDYLDRKYTFNDWHKTVEYGLADEFNGVESIDVEKLADNCDKIIKKVAELNKKAMSEEVDTTKVEERVEEELEFADATLCIAKKDLQWWKLEGRYKVVHARDYMNGLIRHIERLESLDFSAMDNAERRKHVQHFDEYGYVELRENDFYIKELRELIEETK